MANQISFVIQLLDKFTPQAKRLAASADQIKRKFSRFGQQAHVVNRNLSITSRQMKDNAFAMKGVTAAAVPLSASVSAMNKQLVAAGITADALDVKMKTVSASILRTGNAFRFGMRSTLFITAPIGLMANSFANAASTAEETKNFFLEAFPTMGQAGVNAANQMGDAFNFARDEAQRSVATFGLVTQSMGFAEKQSFDLSMKMNKLAADVASFRDANPTDVIHAFTGALTGETERLKQLGVVIRQEEVVARVQAMGLKATTIEQKQKAKALATLAILQERFAKDSGDLARTSESLANRQRKLAAEYRNLQVEIGKRLLPVKLKLVNAVIKLIDMFMRMPRPLQNTILAVLGIIAVIGPLAMIVGVAILAFNGLMAVVTAISLPFLGIGLAIAAAVGVLVYLAVWLSKSEAFMYAVWRPLKGLFAAFIDLGRAIAGLFKWVFSKLGWGKELDSATGGANKLNGAMVMLLGTIQAIVEGLTFIVDAYAKIGKLKGAAEDIGGFVKDKVQEKIGVKTKVDVNTNLIEAVEKIKQAGQLPTFQARVAAGALPEVAAREILQKQVIIQQGQNKVKSELDININTPMGTSANVEARTDADQTVTTKNGVNLYQQ